MQTKIVIIGAGPAGVSVVETLRAYDTSSAISMLSAEPYLPYSPPAMADHFLTGSGAHLWRDEKWPGQMKLDYRPAVSVASVDPADHRLRLENGESLAYDRLVVATGSRLYAPLPGADMPGVYNFKSLSAAEALVGRVKRGEAHTAIIVGAGFIGTEIALLLSDLGVQVTQYEMLAGVMPAVLDERTSEFVLGAMRQRGVDIHLNTAVAAFIGDSRATGIQLKSGENKQADILIAATGVRPNLDFLASSGIEHRWGVSVDDRLRTSVKDVYAAGDVVEAPDRLTGECYVHAIFPNAIEQGHVVGLNLAGFDVRYEGAERMNSLKHLIGDIRAAGALRTLLTRQEDVRKLKDRLLEPSFGQGSLVWAAL
jgi:NAD(P)H-nitrite reductase large subunit